LTCPLNGCFWQMPLNHRNNTRTSRRRSRKYIPERIIGHRVRRRSGDDRDPNIEGDDLSVRRSPFKVNAMKFVVEDYVPRRTSFKSSIARCFTGRRTQIEFAARPTCTSVADPRQPVRPAHHPRDQTLLGVWLCVEVPRYPDVGSRAIGPRSELVTWRTKRVEPELCPRRSLLD